jgi:glycosyltransferase involved in cell wall biosynthesis
MASLSSSILRATNRREYSKLNILCINHDESFQVMLAQTGHNFYFLHHPQIRPWDRSIRPLPKNCILLSGKEPKDQIKQEMQFDLALCQNRMHDFQLLWGICRQISCPILIAENALTFPDMNPFEAEALANQQYNISVFNSEFLANSWGFETSDDDIFAIPYGIDTEFFKGWCGKDGKILTIVNDYIKKNAISGFNCWSKVTNGLPTNPVGNTKDFSKATKNIDELLKVYQNASVFLNTSSWLSCPKSVLEAMSVGCPVVTTATTILPEIIENGVNGYISHDEKELREMVIELLENPAKGMEFGERARKTIIEKFNINNFKDSWNEVLNNAVGKPSATLIFRD